MAKKPKDDRQQELNLVVPLKTSEHMQRVKDRHKADVRSTIREHFPTVHYANLKQEEKRYRDLSKSPKLSYTKRRYYEHRANALKLLASNMIKEFPAEIERAIITEIVVRLEKNRQKKNGRGTS